MLLLLLLLMSGLFAFISLLCAQAYPRVLSFRRFHLLLLAGVCLSGLPMSVCSWLQLLTYFFFANSGRPAIVWAMNFKFQKILHWGSFPLMTRSGDSQTYVLCCNYQIFGFSIKANISQPPIWLPLIYIWFFQSFRVFSASSFPSKIPVAVVGHGVLNFFYAFRIGSYHFIYHF